MGDAGIWAAVAVACLTVMIGPVGQVLVFVVYARQRVVAVSMVNISMSAAAALSVMMFCVLLDLGVFGGALAGLVVGGLGFLVATTLLRSEHLKLRSRLAACYLRPALRFGLRAAGQRAGLLIGADRPALGLRPGK